MQEQADFSYQQGTSDFIELRELMFSELPIRVCVDKNWYDDIESDGFFLEKYNPTTGATVETSAGDGIVWVAILDGQGKVIFNDETEDKEISSLFTEEQAAILFRQAQELEAAGLSQAA